MPIKTDCYLSLLKKYRESYPDAHFEVITRTAKHVLSPSWELLQKIKNDKISFVEYTPLLIQELQSEKAINKMRELKRLSKEKDVYLICYEKDSSVCHRSIVKKLIEDLEEDEK